MIAKPGNGFENSLVIAENIKTGYCVLEQLSIQIMKTSEDPSLYRFRNDFHTNILKSPKWREPNAQNLLNDHTKCSVCMQFPLSNWKNGVIHATRMDELSNNCYMEEVTNGYIRCESMAWIKQKMQTYKYTVYS